MPRKLIYHVATSVDHFIAHDDGSVDGFLTEGQHIGDYISELQNYDTVLMGRNTYEWGYQFGIQPGMPSPTYGHMMQYVFSQSMPHYDHEQLKVIRDNPIDFVERLKSQSGGTIYLCGGGQLAASLMRANHIDELILKVNPVVFGSGIGLFADLDMTQHLQLLNAKAYTNGVIVTHYTVC